MLQVEADAHRPGKIWQGQGHDPEQVRWGLENLNLTQERLNELGFGKIMRPLQTSCDNHMGTDWSRIAHLGRRRSSTLLSDWYQADKSPD